MQTFFRWVVLCACSGLFAAEPEREWNLLVFLNGHNDLSEFGSININQLETIGSSDEINFIVQWADVGNEKTHRLRIARDEDNNKVTSPFIESLPRVDMGNHRNLVDFVAWSAKNYPARHYFVVVWNHGFGWHRKARTRAISFDDLSGNYISTQQLGTAASEISHLLGRKIDIFGADACLMAMAEVAAEIADSARYLVASEENEPSLGWPYHMLADWWVKNPHATASEIGNNLVLDYAKWFENQTDITLSLIDLDQLSWLYHAMSRTQEELRSLNSTELSAVRAKLGEALHFSSDDYVDIGHWASLLSRSVARLQAPGLELIDSLQQVVVANATSPDLKNATGLSFWFPKDRATYEKHKDNYQMLQISAYTQWDKLLQHLWSTNQKSFWGSEHYLTTALASPYYASYP